MLSDAQRAALALRLRRGRPSEPEPIPRRPTGLVDLPLSRGQEQLWFIDRFAPGQPAYNIPVALRLTGPLDHHALAAALTALTARHEALRTRLATGAAGAPGQVIDPPHPVPLPLTDLSTLPPGARGTRLQEILDSAAMAPFSLAEGPLLRASLLRLAAAEHLLALVVHHAVFDGWSVGVLVTELAALYQAEVTGEPSGLAGLPIQFADYALWERDRLAGPLLGELTSYWRATLDGCETVRFPLDLPRPPVEEFGGALADRQTSPELLAALRELSRGHGTTLFVTLLAALLTLLHRYTGQADLTVGTFSAGRGRPELAPLIGFLVNTLPIRADLSGDPPFTEVLARVKAATVGAYAHQDLPFGTLVEALGAPRDASRGRVFQIALSYAERDDTPVHGGGVAFATTALARLSAAKFDLDILAEARRDGLWFECSYKTSLLREATVQRLLGHLDVLLHGVAADPSARLSQLPLLTEAEQHQELVTWNDTAASFPAGCVHTLIEAQAARTPGGVAAQFEDQALTYADLDRQANQIARKLRELGTGPEVLVGVCMRPGLRRLAALLGIWKAGGGYVPLDPALPAERLAFMMADTGMALVLADESAHARLPATRPAVLALDTGWRQIAALDGGALTGVDVTSANVAYVIYTSGSTGQPKGVVVEHRQAANFLQGMVRFCELRPRDVVLQFSSLSFDASVHDTFMPLLAGARAVLARQETLHSPPRLTALMRQTGVTFAILTPSVVSLLTGGDLPSLRVLMVGGEEFPPELVRRWLRPGLRLVNDYGPTETTVSASVAELDRGTPMPPPIGWPIANCQTYVLDGHGNLLPAGAPGELHIGGAGVARGYLNRPDLTRQRFIPDPFSPRPGARLYATGDLVHRRPDGSVVFLRRIDGQVKVRGLRIELGEIEAALASHPAVAQAAAAVRPDPAGEPQLAAYARLRPGASPTPAQLKAHLATSLPPGLVPAHVIIVTEFPLTTSGKIDRAALPAPTPQPATHAGTAAASSTSEPPASFTESLLADLYARVLGTAPAATTDSFFDLGGSSLQVMRLVDLIYRELRVDAGVSTVFAHPTPRQLAARIDALRAGAGPQDGAGTPDGPLVRLGDGAGELPLYLIHAVGGTVWDYRRLAAELAGTFAVHGLQAPAFATAPAPTPLPAATSLAALVTSYTRLIQAAQPAGPYRLAGWSMGGTLAFEIARRLEQAGQPVALLGLLDAPFTLPDTAGLSRSQQVSQFAADVAQALGWDAAPAPGHVDASGEEQLAWLAGRLGTGSDQLRRRCEVFTAHQRILSGYIPGGAPVAAPTLIVSANRSPNAPARARWPHLLRGPVTTVAVDGDHYSFLRPPLVADVGTSFLKWQADHDR